MWLFESGLMLSKSAKMYFFQVPQAGSPTTQHMGGYGSPGGTPTPSATLAAAVAAGFSDVVFTSSSNVSVNNHDHLIYDSINMSQVQNYSPSLSSSLGTVCSLFHLCAVPFLFILFLFYFGFVGSSLTPLTPIPVSDVGKSMLHSPSLSVLGDQQFQTGGLTISVLS